jgi:hypothetical protein
MAETGSWSPIYDEDGLIATIREAISAATNRGEFYASPNAGPAFCQGDVIRFESGAPVIDEDGVATEVGAFKYWLLLADTCDIDRAISDATWIWMVPISERLGATQDDLDALRSYRLFRLFYLPTWTSGPDTTLVADLTNAVSLHKHALRSRVEVVARLARPGWVLLHACMIRFLARGDTRWE